MSTIKLYQTDVYTKEWDAEIVSINDSGSIFLDQTAFFPEGGGQSCDTGTLEIKVKKNIFKYKVIDAQEAGDDVAHTLEATDAAAENHRLSVGEKVHCTLDWDRRFDNMQRHCGEHILSGVFHKELGGVNRGFHMGNEYITIDISLENQPLTEGNAKPEELTYEMALHCEKLANKVIWSNAPVSVYRFDTREEAEIMPLRKQLAFDEDISIVCIGPVEDPDDCVACCGTHPSTAGQVGLIKIYKVEKYKNMFRVYLEAGERAFDDYALKHTMLMNLSNSYSSSVEDFPSKLRAQEEKMAAVKNELHHIKKAFIENECQKLNAELDEAGDSPVLIYRLPDLSMDDAFNMAKTYMGKDLCKGKLILLYSVPDTSYILVSDGSIKCGALVKDYASFYQGKGGGNDISARAIFSKEDDAVLFSDLLSKHLQ